MLRAEGEVAHGFDERTSIEDLRTCTRTIATYIAAWCGLRRAGEAPRAAGRRVPRSPPPAFAQADWPNRPIRVIVPFAPGGSSDVLARLIQPGLGAALGQSMIVENRSGAGSMLGTEAVARSPADGYTLLLADLPYAIVPALQARMPYDVERDLVPVVMVGVHRC